MSTTLSRDALYALVWQTPMRRLASTFGMSDVALAKHCKKLDIPLPGLGYWAKKEAGQAVAQVALPARGLGKSYEIHFGGDNRSGYPARPEEIASESIAPLPEFEGDIAAVRERARTIVGRVSYPSLAKLHPATTKLLQQDERRRAKQAASSWPSTLYTPFFDTAPDKRRLRIMNALFLALARCGCRPSTSRRESYELSTLIGDVAMPFVLAPLGFNHRERDRSGKVFENKGRVLLELSWYEPPSEIVTRWEDRDDLPLEMQLTEITVELLVAGEWGLRDKAQRQHAYRLERKTAAEAELRRREEEARRKEEERVAKAAQARREQLFLEAESLRKANEVRAYVAARMERAKSTHGGASAELEEWARWAHREADALDPLRNDA